MVTVVGKMEDNAVVCPRCRSLLSYGNNDMNVADGNGVVVFYEVKCPICNRNIIVDVEDKPKINKE